MALHMRIKKKIAMDPFDSDVMSFKRPSPSFADALCSAV
jgi:hypothetical protein